MGRVARATKFSGFVLGLAVGWATLRGSIRPANADETKDPSSAVTGAQCHVKGTTAPVKDTVVFDARSGGKPIAKLTGATLPATLSDFAADPMANRARLATSRGSGALRIDGFAAASAFSFYTGKDVWISSPHLAITSGQKIAVVAAANNSLTAELKVAGTSNQTVRGSGACDAYTFDRVTQVAFDVPTNGRGWQTKSTTTDIFDAPGGTAILTLKMIEGTGQLFWSTESRSGYVHILARADVSIDAWARQSDLAPLKKGEMVDQLATPTPNAQTGATLALEKAPRLVKATKDIPIRAKRDLKAPTIGEVETDAEVYVMETVAGWTNVLPKSLGLLPADDQGFWIQASEVPKDNP